MSCIYDLMETYSVLYTPEVYDLIYDIEITKNGQETVMVTIEKPPLYK